MRNAFTVDLEDWYCTRVMGQILPRTKWDSCESRVHVGTERLLRLLKESKVEATFFVLGYIADREPEVIEAIAAEGHEIATHGYFHRPLTALTRNEFRCDLEQSITAITRITNGSVLGHRAPDFSMTDLAGDWAFDVLRDCGIVYDSSIFPAWWRSAEHRRTDGAVTSIYHQSNGLIEMPISCVDVLGLSFPATGGAYCRQVPYEVTRRLVERCNKLRRGMMFYIHPWELDSGQPRLPLPRLQSVRHYRGIDTMYEKLERLLCEFPFTSIRNILQNS